MNKTTNQKDVQAVLEEYLGNKKAAKVAEALCAVMQSESQHTHNGKTFFVSEDSNGTLVLTMESKVEEKVKKVLEKNLEPDEVDECLNKLSSKTEVSAEKTEETEIEFFCVEGYESTIYKEMLQHNPTNDKELLFLGYLNRAITYKTNAFKTPVYDPSIDKNGKLQFLPGFKPATGFSANEVKNLAKEKGLRFGTIEEYSFLLATLIKKLIEEGKYSETDAWQAICSNKIIADLDGSELTGSKRICEKCYMATGVDKFIFSEAHQQTAISTGLFPVYGDLYDSLAAEKKYANAVPWLVYSE